MTQHSSSRVIQRRARKRPKTGFNLLLMDADPNLRDTLRQCAARHRLNVLPVPPNQTTGRDAPAQTTSDQATADQDTNVLAELPDGQGETAWTDQPIDLAIIPFDATDPTALTHALEKVRSADPRAQVLGVCEEDQFQQALDAVRAGCEDVIIRSADEEEWNARLEQALERRRTDLKERRDHERLRKLCKRLNRVRREVTHQVDILCNDLVSAYQELAGQMQQAVQSSEYQAQLRDELDLENVIRKTLEYILEKVGPTNAAIFLPSTFDEYTLGGYINYDCTGESADILLQHLADAVAPRMAQRVGPLHITDNETLSHWLGEDGAYLTDSHVLAFPCRFEDEALGIVVLFRESQQPFESAVVETCTGIAPILGHALERIIRIHHRHLPDDDAPTGFEPAEETPF